MSNSISDQEWEQRRLCVDPSCIGVIGPDGRCKECGLAADAPSGQATTDSQPMETQQEDALPLADEQPPPSADMVEETIRDEEWEQRVLCRDESCIGVIGADGRCKECGLKYEPDPQDD